MKEINTMSERELSAITSIMIINAIILYIEFVLFQMFAGFFHDNLFYAIFTFISLINMILIILNFILTLNKIRKEEVSQKLNKTGSSITIIIVIFLLFELIITFLYYAGLFEI